MPSEGCTFSLSSYNAFPRETSLLSKNVFIIFVRVVGNTVLHRRL